VRDGPIRAALSDRFRTNAEQAGVGLDMKASGAMHPLGSEVVKACLPHGQRKPFRHNMMALMTVTGAKGSVVNFSQVRGAAGAAGLPRAAALCMGYGHAGLPRCFSSASLGGEELLRVRMLAVGRGSGGRSAVLRCRGSFPSAERDRYLTACG
jgi:hypothetical protein